VPDRNGLALPGAKCMPVNSQDLLAQAKTDNQEVDINEAQRLMSLGAIPLDVREQDEVDQGVLPGAVHIPRGFLEVRIETTVPDRTRPIAIYCDGGLRAVFAAKTLQELGYTDVVSVAGGFNGWKSAGLPWSVPK